MTVQDLATSYQDQIDEAENGIRDILAAAGINLYGQAGDTYSFDVTGRGIAIKGHFLGHGHNERDWTTHNFYTWDELKARREKLEAHLGKVKKRGTVYHIVETLDYDGQTVTWCHEGWKNNNYRTLPIEDLERMGVRPCKNCTQRMSA